MANITVSTDIDTLLRSADNAAARASIGADVRTDANGAFSAGDLGGNARGADAINIQATRNNVTKVASGSSSIAIGARTTASSSNGIALGDGATASGNYGSAALGNYCSASGYYGSSASGYNSVASVQYATASGCYATASGYYSAAFGYSASATNDSATALGKNATASGYASTALGNSTKTTVMRTAEIGYWGGVNVRSGGIRVHSTGMVAQTIQNRSTAYGDGGATKGSEADNTVIREGIALRRNGNEILVDLNIGGTVTTLSLGTAS